MIEALTLLQQIRANFTGQVSARLETSRYMDEESASGHIWVSVPDMDDFILRVSVDELRNVPDVDAYYASIVAAVREHFLRQQESKSTNR